MNSKRKRQDLLFPFIDKKKEIWKKPIKSERQEKTIQYLKINETINNKEVRELLGLADSTSEYVKTETDIHQKNLA